MRERSASGAGARVASELLQRYVRYLIDTKQDPLVALYVCECVSERVRVCVSE